MRILLGSVDIAGQLSTYADGFRRLGCHVTTVVSERNPYYPDARYDVDIGSEEIRFSFKLNLLSQAAKLLYLDARKGLITRHDVFVFLWGGKSLLDLNSEYPLLKLLGKKLVTIFNGDDIRHWSSYSQQMESLIRTKSCVPLQDIDLNYKNDPLVRPLRNLRMAESYSDLILSVPNQSALAVRPYMHFFVPLDLSDYQSAAPGREFPVVVHSPSSKAIKGTGLILSTLERLKSEGVRFELRFLHGLSNQRVKEELRDADVVIDQLHLPLHGKLGVEAMASGCALATCDREEFEPLPPSRPIWHVGPENLEDGLRRLLTDRELRLRLARAGRRHVERYHDHVKVARRVTDHLKADITEHYDHYPTFFAREYRLPEGVEVPERLRRMTSQVVQRWGLPEGADPRDMIERGLMSAEGLDSMDAIPRWKTTPVGAEPITA